MGLLDKLLKPFVQQAGQSIALQDVIESHSQAYFYGEIASLAQLKPETKQAFIDEFKEIVVQMRAADDPILKMRESLAGAVIGYAETTVLALTEQEKDLMWLASECGISGQLHHHIEQLWKHCASMSHDGWWCGTDEYDAEKLVAIANFSGALALYFMNGLNKVRVISGDFTKEDDWFAPFMRSMLIFQEDRYRSEINLPPVVEKPEDAFAHGTFVNYVIGGHENPYTAWKHDYQAAVDLGGLSESVFS